MPENNKLSDEQLVKTALDGDTGSFGVLVDKYWKIAIALAMSKMNEPNEAEDVAQESFVKAFVHLHHLREPSRFAGWLAKIVNQQCIDRLRKSSRFKTAATNNGDVNNVADCVVAVSQNPGLSKQQIRFVRKTIKKLPEKFRKVIIMRFVGNYSASQIAKKLGKRHSTIRVHLHRAYKILREELSPLLEEVDEL